MNFTPSATFAERWNNSPAAMKQAIFDELSDVITLLDPQTPVETFEFRTPNLHEQLGHLQTAHLETLSLIAKRQRQERADALLPVLEQRLDDKLTEGMGELSVSLKAWIRAVIQEELDKDK